LRRNRNRLVVENVTGAGGTTGSTRAMRARPDGYTILIETSSFREIADARSREVNLFEPFQSEGSFAEG